MDNDERGMHISPDGVSPDGNKRTSHYVLSYRRRDRAGSARIEGRSSPPRSWWSTIGGVLSVTSGSRAVFRCQPSTSALLGRGSIDASNRWRGTYLGNAPLNKRTREVSLEKSYVHTRLIISLLLVSYRESTYQKNTAHMNKED